MHKFCSFIIALLTVPICSNASRSTSRDLFTQKDFPNLPSLVDLKDRANQLHTEQRYKEAAGLYEQGLQESRALRQPRMALRFLMGLGNVAFVTFEYRKALTYYLEARSEALSLGDSTTASGVSENLSTLYSRMSDIPSAALAIAEAMNHAKRSGTGPLRASLLLNAGSIRGKQGDLDGARKLYADGIEAADRAGDATVLAEALDQFGYHLLRASDLGAAEEVFVEAFRIRKLRVRRHLANSLRNLAMLRLAQQDPCSALQLIQEAMKVASETRLSFPPLFLFYQRGRALAGCGQPARALADFEKAIQLARDWRLGVLPADTFRISADVSIQQIVSSYIETGWQVYRQTRDRALLARLLVSGEENRAASLVQSSPGNRPPQYWETLAQLREMEIASLAGKAGSDDQAAVLRVRLSEIEAQSAPGEGAAPLKNSPQKNEIRPSDKTLSYFQNVLSGAEAFVSFHLGETESYQWVVTNSRFEVHVRPGRKIIANAVRAFRNELQNRGQTEGATALYQMLFSDLSEEALSRTEWILSLDGSLFELPFAALQRSTNKGPEFLIEGRSIRIVPSLMSVAARATRGPTMGLAGFLGVGDPVLNTADPRWQGVVGTETSLQLARLPATRTELQVSSLAWASQARILTGTATTRSSIQAALTTSPAVAHFATHIVEQPGAPERALIAIGLTSNGVADFLTPSEVSSLHHRVGLVTLSGCASGRGKTVPGAGLLGLTRAWLAAGARSVAATYWPLRDGTGPFFDVFYKSLRTETAAGFSTAAAARALQSAQVQALRSKEWKARTDMWAAFFVTGQE